MSKPSLPYYVTRRNGAGKDVTYWVVEALSVSPDNSEVWYTDSTGAINGIVTFATGAVIQAANGTAALPSYSFVSEPSTGFGWGGAGNIAASSAGTYVGGFIGAGIQLASTKVLGWSPSTFAAAGDDTGISRSAAGILFVGNGTQGDATGVLQALTLRAGANISTSTNGSFTWNAETKSRISSTSDGIMNMSNVAATIGSVVKVDALPTIASGFGGSPSITAGSTPFAGSVNVGTGGAATNGVINFNGTAFPSAPFAVATNSVSHASPSQAVATTTQLTLFAATAWPANSIVSWICVSPK